MDEVRWQERMERTERAIGAYVLAGSLALGAALPGHQELYDPTETASTTVVLPADDRVYDRSKASSIMAVLPRAHDGLHDHPEPRSIMVSLTSPVIVTGAGLPSLTQPPDLQLPGQQAVPPR
jgi:hypothetical protein